jgi:hypothetical protein
MSFARRGSDPALSVSGRFEPGPPRQPIESTLTIQIPKRKGRLAAGGALVAAAGIALFASFAGPGPKTLPKTVHALARGHEQAVTFMIIVPKESPEPPRATSGKLKAYDRKELTAKLDEIAETITPCRDLRGPRGPGSVHIDFDNAGAVRGIYIGPPYRNTPGGACIVERFRSVRITPYLGYQARVNYVFQNPW